MRVLVVGGAGYIGGYLTDVLRQHGFYTAVYDNLLYERIYLKNVPFHYGDVRDTDSLLRILPGYDAVVWLAAIVGDGACAVDPRLALEVNDRCVHWLSCNYSGKIIYTSTCSVYGKQDGVLDENSPVNPLSVYGNTKLAAEHHLKQHAKLYTVFRLGTLFGVGDEHSRIRLDLVVNTLAVKAARGEALTVFGGEQWRPLLHVKDVGHAVLHALQHDVQGIFNLAYRNTTIREIAQEIVRIIPTATLSLTDVPVEGLRNYRVNSEKFAATGWLPRYDLTVGIFEIMDLVQSHRIKDFKDKVYFNVHYIGDLYGTRK